MACFTLSDMDVSPSGALLLLPFSVAGSLLPVAPAVPGEPAKGPRRQLVNKSMYSFQIRRRTDIPDLYP